MLVNTVPRNKQWISKMCCKRYECSGSRVQTGDKPWICKMCEQMFTIPDDLNIHMLIHTGDKPWICEMCDIKFTHCIDLKQHMLVHIQEHDHAYCMR